MKKKRINLISKFFELSEKLIEANRYINLSHNDKIILLWDLLDDNNSKDVTVKVIHKERSSTYHGLKYVPLYILRIINKHLNELVKNEEIKVKIRKKDNWYIF